MSLLATVVLAPDELERLDLIGAGMVDDLGFDIGRLDGGPAEQDLVFIADQQDSVEAQFRARLKLQRVRGPPSAASTRLTFDLTFDLDAHAPRRTRDNTVGLIQIKGVE